MDIKETKKINFFEEKIFRKFDLPDLITMGMFMIILILMIILFIKRFLVGHY